MKVNKEKSVYQAGKEVFPDWQQTNYIYKVFKTFGEYVLKAKVIFPSAGDHNLNGFAWIQSVVGKQERVLYHFNLYCLENRVNCLFCTHTRFLWLENRRAGVSFSHRNETNNLGIPVLNSS
ncbi:MAG: hypothetical protein PF693_04105 [Spirochaetia bacterium]|nr:hypothetical protein [Spirochaetia bacterium]